MATQKPQTHSLGGRQCRTVSAYQHICRAISTNGRGSNSCITIQIPMLDVYVYCHLNLYIGRTCVILSQPLFVCVHVCVHVCVACVCMHPLTFGMQPKHITSNNERSSMLTTTSLMAVATYLTSYGYGVMILSSSTQRHSYISMHACKIALHPL